MENHEQTPVSAPAPKSGSSLPLIGVLGVALVAGVAYFTQSGDQQPAATNEKTPSDTPTTTAQYKNGTYDVLGAYTSPAGPEQIDVKVTLTDGVISDATVTRLATHKKSMFMQDTFINNFKPLVIGKSIDDVQLDKVSGSSLTPKGWNDAIAKIQAEAKI